MDASESGDFFALERAFYTGDFQYVVQQDVSTLSEAHKQRASVLVARAKIYTGKARAVASQYKSSKEPSEAIIGRYADYTLGIKGAADAAEKIIEASSDDVTVQFLGGLVLVAEKKYNEALTLLGKHEGSLECVSLIVQIHLLQNHVDLAAKLVQEAKKWAQDNIVFNLAEAWTNLRQGGDQAQSAFYIYEELATGGVSSARSLIGQAVAQLELGRIPEAEELFKEALELEPENPEALANSIATAILAGNDYSDLESKLEQVAKDHPSLVDLAAKSQLFDSIVTKYKAAA